MLKVQRACRSPSPNVCLDPLANLRSFWRYRRLILLTHDGLLLANPGKVRLADDPGEEHRSSFVASSRADLRYFGHLPWIRNRFSARSYPLESTFILVP